MKCLEGAKHLNWMKLLDFWKSWLWCLPAYNYTSEWNEKMSLIIRKCMKVMGENLTGEISENYLLLPVWVLMCLLSNEGRSNALAQTLQGSRDRDLFDLAIVVKIGGETEHSSDSPSELFGCRNILKRIKNYTRSWIYIYHKYHVCSMVFRIRRFKLMYIFFCIR